jgi:hypothetical protein
MIDTDWGADNYTVQVFNGVSQKADASFEIARQYAQNLATLADSFAIPLSGSIPEIDIPDGSFAEISMPEIPSSVLEKHLILTDAPSDPVLSDIPSINIATLPVEPENYSPNSIEKPIINIPSAPGVPLLSSIQLPDVPDLTIPQAPEDQEIVMPVAPVLNIPSFSVQAPQIEDISIPTSQVYQGSIYNSDVMLSLLKKVLNDIENGGTGMNIDIERAIYDRGKERQRVENEILYRNTEDMYGSSGFDLPPIAFASKLADVGKEISRKNDQIGWEIMISQAELEQGNIKFSVEQVVAIEKMFREFYVSNEARSLESIKINNEAGVRIYDAMVAFQKLKLSEYQTRVTAYKDRIEAEKIRIDSYRIEMEGAKLSLENKEVLYKIFGHQASIIETKAKIYNFTLESARIESDIQSQKIEQAKIANDIYRAKIEAESLKSEIYKVETEAERNNVLSYSESVKAYESKVSAKLEVARIKALDSENVLKSNQQKIDKWGQEISAWAQEIDAQIKAAGFDVSLYKTESEVYATKIQGAASKNSITIENIRAQLERAKLELQQSETIAQVAIQGYTSLNTLKVEASKGVLNAGAQLAASAMNAINASAGISANDSYSRSTSESTSSSSSTSTSVSHNYNYK